MYFTLICFKLFESTIYHIDIGCLEYRPTWLLLKKAIPIIKGTLGRVGYFNYVCCKRFVFNMDFSINLGRCPTFFIFCMQYLGVFASKTVLQKWTHRIQYFSNGNQQFPEWPKLSIHVNLIGVNISEHNRTIGNSTKYQKICPLVQVKVKTFSLQIYTS